MGIFHMYQNYSLAWSIALERTLCGFQAHVGVRTSGGQPAAAQRFTLDDGKLNIRITPSEGWKSIIAMSDDAKAEFALYIAEYGERSFEPPTPERLSLTTSYAYRTQS